MHLDKNIKIDLGGIIINYPFGHKGHSDADVLYVQLQMQFLGQFQWEI